MKRSLSPKAIGIVAILFGIVGSAPVQATPWSPVTSIKVRYFSGVSNRTAVWPGNSGFESPIRWSPNRRFLYFVSHRGDLDENKEQYELCIFRAKDLRNALTSERTFSPEPIARISRFGSGVGVSADRGAFAEIAWLGDDTALDFIAPDLSDTFQAYRLSLPAATVTQMTSVPNGARVLEMRHESYVMASPERPVTDARQDSVGIPLDYGLDFGGLQPLLAPAKYVRVLLGTAHNAPFPIDNVMENWGSFSPDGRSRTFRRRVTRDTDELIIVRAASMETISVKSVPASASRIAWLWSDDSRWLFLVARETRSTAQSASVIVLDASDGKVSCFPLQTRVPVAMKWSEVEGCLRLTERSGTLQQVFHRTDDDWVISTIDTPAAARGSSAETGDLSDPSLMSVSIREDVNSPPEVVARIASREITISEPDSSLTGIDRCEVTPLEFDDSHGRKITAGLLMPKGSTKKVPLVIQVDHEGRYSNRFFLPDGESPAFHAAQSLAARGIAVVIVDGNDISTPVDQEAVDFAGRIEGVVSAVARLADIDRSRIGISGHSRCGYWIYYYLTHPGGIAFSAAIVSDSFDGGYSTYLLSLRESGTALFGGATGKWIGLKSGASFWTAKGDWLERETSFNADRIRTPILFSYHGQGYSRETLALQFDLYFGGQVGALLANRKPAQWLILPQSNHVPCLPAERLAAQEWTVDWFCFWLKDQIPSDTERAARWAILRQQQDEVLKTPPPPKGKWVFVEDKPDAAKPQALPSTAAEKN